ncbi:hypothetical protein L6164_012190 [Bauhinia variegata]|uniref:Uncharacterized protein n=1 Tax=Bauhinia variegata TaxID=167791 RepID=A0ACB9PEG3_BAUVA|nr:hypothetical protein L6164_012190 [Bauhinia variegata]
MLRRSKHGAFCTTINLLNFTASFLYSSRAFSKSGRNLTYPETNTSKLIVPTKPTSFSSQILQISNKTSSPVVNSVCSLLSDPMSCTEDLDNLLNSYKGELNSNFVLGVLMSYKQLGRTKTLKFFSWAGSQMGFKFDDSVVEYMADFLGRRKLFDDMKCLLMTVSSHNGRVSCRTISTCIRFLGRQGRIREALSLFEEMETVFRCKPDNLVYNNVLFVLCKKQMSTELIDLALTIFQRIESPDTYSFSNLLIGLCKLRKFDTALEIFGQMNKAGALPTRSALNLLIGELCLVSEKDGYVEKVRVKNTRRPYTILVPNLSGNSGAIQPAVAVFWTIYSSGLLPSTFVIVRLLSELCRLGKTEEAIEVLNIVEERKLTCLVEGYSIVIKAVCEHRQLDEASHLFGRMFAQGLKPKLVVYNSIISMLCKLGSLGDATRVFEIMNKNRCLPDNITYSALIHAHCERKNWKAAFDLLIEMLGMGCLPHFHTYNLVDNLLREHDQLDLCLKLERKLENQKLQKLCKSGQLGAASEKLKSMLEKGFLPSAYVRDTFEHEFRKCGKLKMAQQLLQKIEKVQEPEEIM